MLLKPNNCSALVLRGASDDLRTCFEREPVTMLEIRNLVAAIGDKEILHSVNLNIQAGEVHAIMGPNGSGKSTLASVLSGHPSATVLSGSITFEGKNLLELAPEQRAREGIFLGFQYPVEIPGVNNLYFMKAAVNAVRTHRGLPEYDAMDFLSIAQSKMDLLGLDSELANRPVNEGFSGGEKKRNEIFQMSLLEPKLAILE